jgi:hypothetical protein
MSYAPLDETGRLHAVSSGPLSDDIGPSSTASDDEDRRKSLSEPLTLNGTGEHVSDPFYVFREDLYRQLERVDETLTEYLRVVHQTVGATSTDRLSAFLGDQLLTLSISRIPRSIHTKSKNQKSSSNEPFCKPNPHSEMCK